MDDDPMLFSIICQIFKIVYSLFLLQKNTVRIKVYEMNVDSKIIGYKGLAKAFI